MTALPPHPHPHTHSCSSPPPLSPSPSPLQAHTQLDYCITSHTKQECSLSNARILLQINFNDFFFHLHQKKMIIINPHQLITDSLTGTHLVTFTPVHYTCQTKQKTSTVTLTRPK